MCVLQHRSSLTRVMIVVSLLCFVSALDRQVFGALSVTNAEEAEQRFLQLSNEAHRVRAQMKNKMTQQQQMMNATGAPSLVKNEHGSSSTAAAAGADLDAVNEPPTKRERRMTQRVQANEIDSSFGHAASSAAAARSSIKSEPAASSLFLTSSWTIVPHPQIKIEPTTQTISDTPMTDSSTAATRSDSIVASAAAQSSSATSDPPAPRVLPKRRLADLMPPNGF